MLFFCGGDVLSVFLMGIGVVFILCILLNHLLARLPIPSLVIFLGLGVLFGVDGLFQISFDDYTLSETICSICLVFIMFYGGFGTNIRQAKKILAPAILLSSVGVVLMAFLVGGFVYFAFRLPLYASLLMGAVLCSTDAASVFNVLRSKNLALKQNTDSLLEVESGSNDPFSYMLTLILSALCMQESVQIPWMLVQQLGFGVLVGVLTAKGVLFLLHQMDQLSSAERTILLFAASLLSYAFAYALGGNGYLSVYLCGIMMGNSYVPDKKDMVHFFDVLTENCQMIIFFLLGLLVTPSSLPSQFMYALWISLFMILIARPLVCTLLLKPLGFSWNRIAVISMAGLRGVASIVFAIMAVTKGVNYPLNLFNIVFIIVLISLIIQGSLLPKFTEWMKMKDPQGNILKTFNDYQEEEEIRFIQIDLDENHAYVNKTISQIALPEQMLAVLVLKKEETIMPNGDTFLEKGDTLVLAAHAFEETQNYRMKEIYIDEHHKWCQKNIHQLPQNMPYLIVMIKRQKEIIVPHGDTMICENDKLVVLKHS